jgi:hypothetical protein
MTRVAGVYCHSCGWHHRGVAGKTCTQPKWHRPIPASNLDLQTHYVCCLGTTVPQWVRARLRCEAMRDGRTASDLVSEILTAWAKRHGGIP